MKQCSRRYRCNGVTLVELMMAIVILGVLLGIALPSFVFMMERARIESAADDLVTAMRLARSEAVQRNMRVELVADGNYAEGWRVQIQGADPDDALRVFGGFREGVTCEQCEGIICEQCEGIIEFNGMGEAVQGSNTYVLADADRTLCITLTRSGGVTTDDCP